LGFLLGEREGSGEEGKVQVGVQHCLRLMGKGRFMQYVTLVRRNAPCPMVSKNGHQRREDFKNYIGNVVAKKMIEDS